MSKIKTWIAVNWVFISGLLGSITLALQQYVGTPDADPKIYLYAVAMAALSFVANQWRGKGLSIIGIIGTMAGVFQQVQDSGHFTWRQFGMLATIALLSAVAPPPKPQTYEKNAAIVEAKEVPPENQVKDDSKLPIGTDGK